MCDSSLHRQFIAPQTKGQDILKSPRWNELVLIFDEHTLRHTHATRLIQNGLSIYEVKKFLSNTDISTTIRYAHLERREVSSRARDVINQLNSDANKPHLKMV